MGELVTDDLVRLETKLDCPRCQKHISVVTAHDTELVGLIGESKLWVEHAAAVETMRKEHEASHG